MKYREEKELLRAILDYGIACFKLGQVPADNPTKYKELDVKQSDAWRKVYAIISLIDES